MGVTLAGIAGMSLAVSTIVAVRPGETVQLAGYAWTLDGIRDETGSNYTERVSDVRVSRDGETVAVLHPARRAFTTQKQTVSETSIRTNGMADLYAVLGEERDGAAVLRLHYNPLAPWIWFGALVMAAGGGLSLADRRLRIGAPVRRRATVPA
jgi:cytochrome c-type biogenesis protein CcmF